MDQHKTSYAAQPYNTEINVIGGLPDTSLIISHIQNSLDDSSNAIARGDCNDDKNRLPLRTERSKERAERSIRRSFLTFTNGDHEHLIKNLFNSDSPLKDKNFFLLWQFSINNRLFRDVTSHVFAKAYYSGRAGLSKDDIIAYLKELLQKNDDLSISWSESTINVLATKYLNLMSKLGFLSSGRVKTLQHIAPSSEAQVIFLYFAKLYLPHTNDILSNELLPISFISSDDVHERLKRLSLRGFFNMNFNGVTLNVELTHSYKEICYVLYN